MLPVLAAELETRDRAVLSAQQRQIARAVPGLRTEIAPYVDKPVLSLDPRDVFWLVADQKHDPLARADGRYVIPKGPRAELERLSGRGLRVQHIVIAHEVRPGPRLEHLRPQLAGGPRRCSPALARELVGSVPEHPLGARVAAAMVAALRGPARGAGVLARAGRSTLTRLDPIVFGVVGADRTLNAGRPALWIALTAWEW